MQLIIIAIFNDAVTITPPRYLWIIKRAQRPAGLTLSYRCIEP